MKRLDSLPLPAQLLGAACLSGLLLGLLIGTFSGGHSAQGVAVNLGQPWTHRELPFDSLMEAVLASEHWSRGAQPIEDEVEEVEEPEPELPGRPGVFKYLKLVAILREPRLEAVLKPGKMPDSMRELMVSSANEAGLIHVKLDSEVAVGWIVSGISDTYLQITSVESGEIAEYRLFQWD